MKKIIYFIISALLVLAWIYLISKTNMYNEPKPKIETKDTSFHDGSMIEWSPIF